MHQKLWQALSLYRHKWVNGGNTKPFTSVENIAYEAGRRDGFLAGVDAAMGEVNRFFSSREQEEDDL